MNSSAARNGFVMYPFAATGTINFSLALKRRAGAKSMMRPAAKLAFVAITAFSCAWAAVPTHASTLGPLEGRRIPSTPIDGNFGTEGRLDRPAQLIVRDPNEWRDFWVYVNANTPMPPMPPVDFAAEMVLVVALGVHTSGGTSVRIAAVTETDKEILVLVRRISMGPGCAVSEGYTYPTAMARVPRSEKFVHWIFRYEVQDCKGDLVRDLIYSPPRPPPDSLETRRLIARDKVLDVRDGPLLKRGAFTLDETFHPDTYLVGLAPGERREVCFISGPKSHCETVSLGQQRHFVISHERIDYLVRLVGKICEGGGQLRRGKDKLLPLGECTYP